MYVRGLSDGRRGCGCHRNVTDSHLVELALGDAVAVVDDARGLEARGLVELDEQLAHHGGQVLDDVLPVLLDAHRGAVAARVGVHAAHHLPPQRERERERERERDEPCTGLPTGASLLAYQCVDETSCVFLKIRVEMTSKVIMALFC